jgi:hypothetical protein
VVVLVYNSNCTKYIGRRFTVLGWSWAKIGSLHQNKAKKYWGHGSEGQPSRCKALNRNECTTEETNKQTKEQCVNFFYGNEASKNLDA